MMVVVATTFAARAGVDDIERSALFEPRVDPGSGVPYKVLKAGVGGGWNHQQLYFVQKSMTDDGRFIVVCASDDEYGHRRGHRPFWMQRIQVIDLSSDKVIDFGDLNGKSAISGFTTCLDRRNDRIYEVTLREGFFYYDLKAQNPTQRVKVCDIPADLLAEKQKGGEVKIVAGHLTLNAEATGAFLDSTFERKSVQGYIDFTTGKYEKWGETRFFLFHGQTNPRNSRMALACFENCWNLAKYEEAYLTEEERKRMRTGYAWQPFHSECLRPTEWAYPRLQLVEPNRRTTVCPLYVHSASHERWDETGEGFYWCSHSRGVWYHDIRTGDEYPVSPRGMHAFMSADHRFVISDDGYPGSKSYRGRRWRTYFYDRAKKEGVFFNSDMGAYTTEDAPSTLHPDPHPQFVCGDRYAIWTHNTTGRMEWAWAKVSDLAAACGRDVMADLPEFARPERVSKVLTDQFLRTRPESYCPPGYRGNGYNDKGYGEGRHVQYSVVSVWVNAMDCAKKRGDKEALEKLIRLYDDFLPGGTKNACCSCAYHVDDTIFGSIALEAYLHVGDRRCLAEGLRYADTQWTPPCEASLKERHALSESDQQKYWDAGYTPQTRLWIDDMYMINAIQTQAYRATGDRKYVERAAKEMCLYLDELQIKKGADAGLFYHAPDVKFVWGRGDGWMAAGLPLVLRYLPKDSEYRERIVEGYRLMMRALLRYQRADGMWSQLVNLPDHQRNWPEYSCTAMFTYAILEGIRQGLLDSEEYGVAARRAWLKICEGLDEYGNVPQVCCGTGKKDDIEWYWNRIRVHGDPHGQCAVLWCCATLMER